MDERNSFKTLGRAYNSTSGPLREAYRLYLVVSSAVVGALARYLLAGNSGHLRSINTKELFRKGFQNFPMSRVTSFLLQAWVA